MFIITMWSSVEKREVQQNLPEIPLEFFLLDNHTNDRRYYQLIDYCPNNKVTIDENWAKVSWTKMQKNITSWKFPSDNVNSKNSEVK